MKKLQLKQRQVQKVKLATKFILVGSAISLIGAITFFSFFSSQMSNPKIAEAAVTTYTSLTAGNWANVTTVWSTNGTTPCLCSPTVSVVSKNVVINHAINMNVTVAVSGTSIITVSKSGSLINTNYNLDIQGGSLISNGTISINEVRIRAGASAIFNASVTGASRLRFEGNVTLNALTTVTNGNIEFRAGSAITVADGWSANMPNGDIINDGTITFDGNIISILKGGFINSPTGVVAGFGIVETKAGNMTNSGSWDTKVDWCSAGSGIGFSDPENCLDSAAIASGTCGNAYILDWKDTTTYTVTCGDVNASNWSVKGMTCWFYSPLFNTGGSVGGPNRIADWTVRINQSGNVDANDTASVYYYVNGALARTDSYNGLGSPAVFTSSRKILVHSGGTYQVQIKLMNDKANELWQIKSNDITACLLPVITPPSPLPVTLVSFTAKAQNENSVLLNWATVAEVNNDYFTIERSQNGTQFSILTKVEGSGSTTDLHKYSFTDLKPLGGTSYYRLKQTDFNGTSVTFKTVSVTFKTRQTTISSIQISPNPFTDSFTAQFDSPEKEEVSINILSTNGVLVFSEKVVAQAGNNVLNYSNLPGIKKGTYLLRVSGANAVIATGKIVCNK